MGFSLGLFPASEGETTTSRVSGPGYEEALSPRRSSLHPRSGSQEGMQWARVTPQVPWQSRRSRPQREWRLPREPPKNGQRPVSSRTWKVMGFPTPGAVRRETSGSAAGAEDATFPQVPWQSRRSRPQCE